MDEQTFEKEILGALPAGGIAAYYNRWHNRRRETLRHSIAALKVRSIDHHLLAAAMLEGVPAAVEDIVPGFQERLNRYADLQQQLLHDLTKVNKVVSKEITPFQDWLTQL